MGDYTLKFLIKKFSEHEIKADENQKKLISDFKENHPDTPLPDHFQDDFSLPKALKCICEEINELKMKEPKISKSLWGSGFVYREPDKSSEKYLQSVKSLEENKREKHDNTNRLSKNLAHP